MITYPRIIFPLDELKTLKKELKNEIEINGPFLINEPFTINNIDLDINGKSFEKNDLCLLEIKTKFPEKNQNSLNEPTFPKLLKIMLNKMIIFEQLFTSLGVKYNRIRLFFFYDLIKKTN